MTRLHAAFWLAMDLLSPQDRELVLAARGAVGDARVLPPEVWKRYAAAWEHAHAVWQVGFEWDADAWGPSSE